MNAPLSPHPRAAAWIQRLGLEVLEGESGRWAGRFVSEVPHTESGRQDTTACNAIYYLLEPERPINAWHWLASDDTHVLIDGGPVEYIVVDPAGDVQRIVVDAETRPMISVPAGSHKALRLCDPDGFALVGSVVAPAWAPDRVRIEPPAHARRPPWLDDALMAELTTGVASGHAHREPGA
ncbi:cupin domain-containing protein [Microbacterium sp. 10M-3C3]|uniref:cupin domain-containing protein n=1 Tax=Microbacterium sp. 10M-3C3 TaxID=2483401 RepID=UPI000F643B3D|nr:cupin domain-containing protein [Microbacterium sp. 10M-3C3]